MIREIVIPNLGLTMTEAKILEWVKGEGERVDEGLTLLTIETDKAEYEVESPRSGYLHIVEKQGQVCSVNQTIGWVAQDEKEYESHRAAKPREPVPSTTAAREAPPPAEAAPVAGTERIPVSPSARRVAGELRLSLEGIRGTGPNGRIVKEDVLREAAKRRAASASTETETETASRLKKIKRRVPVEGVRAVISKRMHQSLLEAAQLTLTMEVDASELVRLRKVLEGYLKVEGARISINAILVKIAGQALKEHPRLNASLEDGAIVEWESVHIGVAVEVEDGLVVPVVRDADAKNLQQVNDEIESLAARAKAKQLLPDEMNGGTFTLTNLGFLDIEAFTPILNPPESGILGVGKILEKPVVLGGEIKPGKRMMLSLTFDHRLLDGADGARFLKTIRNYIEEPYLLYGAELVRGESRGQR